MKAATRLRCVVLDDYQHVAREMADWNALEARVDLTFLHHHLDSEAATVDALQDADIVVLMRERTPLPARVLARLPRLKLVVTTGHRNGSLDVGAARARGIVVCGTGTLESPTVELTWGLILALARGLPREFAAFREAGPWQSGLGVDLAGKCLGIIGLGRLGTSVARVALAFGMNVIAWSQNLTDARCADAGVLRAASLDQLLARSDFVTIHAVLSERTLGLIGAPQIDAMKRSAFLINASRPGIVDQTALIAALTERRIAGAAVDVFAQEPLPADHVFRRLDNLVATPHIGYVTENAYRLMFGMVVEDIAAWLAGAPVREIVVDHPAVTLSTR